MARGVREEGERKRGSGGKGFPPSLLFPADRDGVGCFNEGYASASLQLSLLPKDLNVGKF